MLCDEGTAERLFPGLPSSRSIRRTASADLVARAVGSERVARTRLLGALDADSAVQFRSENPEHPLPLLLVLLDDVPAHNIEGRLQSRTYETEDGAHRHVVEIIADRVQALSSKSADTSSAA